jgi:hypothetical protein
MIIVWVRRVKAMERHRELGSVALYGRDKLTLQHNSKGERLY